MFMTPNAGDVEPFSGGKGNALFRWRSDLENCSSHLAGLRLDDSLAAAARKPGETSRRAACMMQSTAFDSELDSWVIRASQIES